MEYKRRIKEIRERAARIRAPIVDLCARAGLNPSTFYRWERDDANPRIRTMNRALDAMEASLAERERALVRQIAGHAQ